MHPSRVVTWFAFVFALIFSRVTSAHGQTEETSPSSPSGGQQVFGTELEATTTTTTTTTAPEEFGDGSNQCQVVSLPKGSGAEYLGYFVERRFFFRPGPDFDLMVFRVRLENTILGGEAFQASGYLTFELSELFNSTKSREDLHEIDWILVEVEDFKFVRRWGRDRNALRVSIEGLTKELVTKHWWTVYRYSGFDLFAKGESSWAFDCDPRSHYYEPTRVQLAFVSPPPEVSHVWCWAIIGVLLFVVVVVTTLLFFVIRRSSALQSSQKQWSLGKEFMADKLSPKSTDDPESRAKNLYVVGPVRRPHQEQNDTDPVEDENLYAEISEASFVEWSTKMSEKNLESVSLEAERK
ncbi:uncharacterized protein LOC143035538 [Oratosquilla oratoria]|uniref:uncharacterized protein LOC143035538 n=1 Tax=Oratosquilla oratoria TaxID=337810 RepID=UPI003F7589D5